MLARHVPVRGGLPSLPPLTKEQRSTSTHFESSLTCESARIALAMESNNQRFTRDNDEFQTIVRSATLQRK